MSSFQVVTGNLLDQNVEVIVNPWNRNIFPPWLLLPQGVSGCIKRSAGKEVFKELGRKKRIPLGGAVETVAGNLPFQSIVHVAGINLLWRASEKSVRLSTQNALNIVHVKSYKSIAFPLIGSGTGGAKRDKVSAWMQDEIQKHPYNGQVLIVIKP